MPFPGGRGRWSGEFATSINVGSRPPWGSGTWLAGLAFGGRWSAGEAMMQQADPVAWERMVRLYKACPKDSLTELCEATMAVGTIAPSRPLPREPNRISQQRP